jgi:hypothetical protein
LLSIPIGLGSKLLRILGVSASQSLRFFYAYALGLGILSFAVFCLGISHLLYWWIVLGLIVLSTALILPDLIGMLRGIKLSYWFEQALSQNWLTKLLILAIALMFALNLLSCLVPATDYDDVNHHLVYSKYYAQRQALMPKYDLWMMAAFPQFMEMLNVYGAVFNNGMIIRLTYFLIYFLLCLLILKIVNEALSFEAAVWATAVFIYSEAIAHWVRTAHVDIPMALYTLLALTAIINWGRDKRIGWLYLAMIFSGILLSTKYSGLILVGINIILASFVKFKYKMGLSVKQAVFAVTLLLFASTPFYLLSYVNINTIFFPFFGEASYFDKLLGQQVILGESGPLHKMPDGQMWQRLIGLPALPWRLTIDFKQFGYPIGPIFLSFLPAYLFLRKNFKITLYILCALAFIMFAYLMRGETLASRFLIPILPLLCISVAYVLSQLKEEYQWLFKISILYLLLMIGFNGALVYRQVSRSFPFLAGKYDQTAYLGKTAAHPWGDKLEYIRMYEYINKHFKGENIKILLDRETPGYYLDVDFYDHTMLRTYKNVVFNAGTMKKLGVTHRLFYSGYWGKHDIPLTPSFSRDGVTYSLVHKIETDQYDVSFYRLK